MIEGAADGSARLMGLDMTVRKDRPPPKPPKPKGAPSRPTKYTKELASEICSRIAAGETLIEICQTPGYPVESTVRGWDLDNIDGFSALYARARLMQIDHEVDEIKILSNTRQPDVIKTYKQHVTKDGDIVDIVEERHGDSIEHRKLQIDARKWRAARMAGHKYVVPASVPVQEDDAGETKVTVIGGLPDDA